MDAHDWFSERIGKRLDLTKLEKSELIAEILAERESYLELEKELGKIPNESHIIEIFTGLSYILSALNSISPNTKEITEPYFCIIENKRRLSGKNILYKSSE